MGLFGKKNDEPELIEELPPRRRKTQDETFRVGRALAGDASKNRELKQERLRAAKQRQRKNVATVVGAVVLIGVVVYFWCDCRTRTSFSASASQRAYGGDYG